MKSNNDAVRKAVGSDSYRGNSTPETPGPEPKSQQLRLRELELDQLREIFPMRETRMSKQTLMRFELKPTDPDFPFEIEALDCEISVPITYPQSRPALKVLNKEIPRGFALNLEIGFQNIVREMCHATVMEILGAFDKRLEALLSAPESEALKFISNQDKRHLSIPSKSPNSSTISIPCSHVDQLIAVSSAKQSSIPLPCEELQTFTTEQKLEAFGRRESERKNWRHEWDASHCIKSQTMVNIKALQLIVPSLYPLEPCKIHFDGIEAKEARNAETGFLQRSMHQKDISLMGHVEYIVQNMNILAKTSWQVESATTLLSHLEIEKKVDDQENDSRGCQKALNTDRPPEWTLLDFTALDPIRGVELNSTYSYDSEGISSGEDEKILDIEQVNDSQVKLNQERGTAIIFPLIEFSGIELLELLILEITIKCVRCKVTTEVKELKDCIVKKLSCKKCKQCLAVRYRKNVMHQQNDRAGFLDLQACTVDHILPSHFLPTCAQCSTPYTGPAIVSVPGEKVSNICHNCHQKFTFKFPSVRFLRISLEASLINPNDLNNGSRSRHINEPRDLTAGTELPLRGCCRHYSKSFRWFRFSCCQKLYACDKCHDEAEQHFNEWANRMVCGWCSREQYYNPEECRICRRILLFKRGNGGFWEGGKGTRDKIKMNKNDKRKYRHSGGGSKPSS
ncbi:CHY zinc finger domain-containing protein [Blumeria hordei DH14]|uniref:CHY zinc finger domain-containing protein n=1 Tax=Blumeria graminis f. sp. hordei (strain DH14) TaxID=546991 RepID=N1JNN4_BLUG1|nr:CHY zinc finger domain-containing protein [Blumeria hordei DH14]